MKNILNGALWVIFLMQSCVPAEAPNQTPTTSHEAQVVPILYAYPETPTFSILSWNVEHFLDPYDDPYIDNQRENNPPENMEARRALFLQALRKADADMVLLQEFESAKYLKRLADDSLSDMGYSFFADVPSHGWYMNVVLMSRFPLGKINGYGNVTTPLLDYLDEKGKAETQNHINTRMWSLDVYPAADYHFLLTGVHLKAGRGPRNIAMRKGQINYLVSQWNDRLKTNPQTNIIMAGDLNATPASEELDLLLANDELLAPFIDPIDTAILSHPADAPSRRLDYLLVNEQMLPEMEPESVNVTYFFSADTMRMISDHLPIMGTFHRKDLKL